MRRFLSYSVCNVGGGAAGGLVGRNVLGSVTTSYTIGEVSDRGSIGGLISSNFAGETTNCFWGIETSGQAESAGGTGLSTVQMMDKNTFLNAGWDFVDTWSISAGIDYPRLLWERKDCSRY